MPAPRARRSRSVNPANEDFGASNARKMPLHIVRDVTDDMIVMQEEIFGPILPIRRYDGIDDAIAQVNRRDRPLGALLFRQRRRPSAAACSTGRSRAA